MMSWRNIAASAAVIGLAMGGAISAMESSSEASTGAAAATRVSHLDRITVKGTLRLLAKPRISATASEIINANSGKCLEVYHSLKQNETKVDQYRCNGTKTQFWKFGLVGSFQGNPVYELINANSGKCADVYRFGTSDGTQVNQYTCQGTYNQYWIGVIANGYYVYLNYNSRKVLEVYRSSKADYGKVDQWADNGTLTQSWQTQTSSVAEGR